MNNIRKIKGGVNLKGKIKVPGDKSISHRALIIGSIAKGDTTIEGFLHSEDPLSTWAGTISKQSSSEQHLKSSS